MLSVIILSVFMLNDIRLSVIILNDVMLNVLVMNATFYCYAECYYSYNGYFAVTMVSCDAECRYAECHYVECRGAISRTGFSIFPIQGDLALNRFSKTCFTRSNYTLLY
jgi:hypothetical protein